MTSNPLTIGEFAVKEIGKSRVTKLQKSDKIWEFMHFIDTIFPSLRQIFSQTGLLVFSGTVRLYWF